jgi:hypothetical protein
MSKAIGRVAFTSRLTPVGQFITALQGERRCGNISSQTEQCLRNAFRDLGWDAMESTLSMAVGSEIDRVEREAATLRKLQVEIFGLVDPVASESQQVRVIDDQPSQPTARTDGEHASNLDL